MTMVASSVVACTDVVSESNFAGISCLIISQSNATEIELTNDGYIHPSPDFWGNRAAHIINIVHNVDDNIRRKILFKQI